ncbi:hypothetical protein [uncultured Limnohabitans sp.]|uniref:hypothetical protein n=1 Tax=uncultured Limnohabitans sp. TaxID=768543 RepID=UPI0026192EE8|nr:hypothetical protein [uncultured Limnohabitans sp.]
MGSVGKFGWITQMTKKCLCLATGVTAVHWVNVRFVGFEGLWAEIVGEITWLDGLGQRSSASQQFWGDLLPKRVHEVATC